jgi:SAM-dependent methyltransferase
VQPDPKHVVATGYDGIASLYLARYASSTVRDAWLDALIGYLPKPHSHVLDLGCGAGVPVAQRLAALGHGVLGIDGSARQIELARSNVPRATFLQADMTTVELAESSFDGVAAFYSIMHVPAAEQGEVLCHVATWLKPRGVFVASFGAGPAGDWRGKWLGTEMFFSHNSEATTLSLVRQAGLDVCRAELVDQDNEDARFFWVVARKSAKTPA